jgi:hypothetical protein
VRLPNPLDEIRFNTDTDAEVGFGPKFGEVDDADAALEAIVRPVDRTACLRFEASSPYDCCSFSSSRACYKQARTIEMDERGQGRKCERNGREKGNDIGTPGFKRQELGPMFRRGGGMGVETEEGINLIE